MAGGEVAQCGRHPLRVLHVPDIFDLEAEPCSAPGGMVYEDGLEIGLHDVDERTRAAADIFAMALVARSPGPDAGDLLAYKAGREHHVAHLGPGHRLRGQLGLHVQVAEDLHRPLVRDVRAGRVRDPRRPSNDLASYVQPG